MRVNVSFPDGHKDTVNFKADDTIVEFSTRLLAQSPAKYSKPTLWKSHYVKHTSSDGESRAIDMSSSDTIPFVENDLVEVLEGAPLSCPQPLQVVEIDDKTKTFVLNEARLRSVLLAHEVADKPVVVVSVAGPFRAGKSFLLNYFLQYLQAENEEAFMKSAHVLDDSKGFRWKHGVERETTGMWMWSRPFLRKLPSGEEVAVVLVDTQGTFDNKTTMKENASIFALNSLVSSFQIYNVKEKIQEDVLQHMHLFTSYGVMVKRTETDLNREEAVKPFQALEFLIRDWEFESHAPGAVGGQEYLSAVLNAPAEDSAKELKEVREQLKGCFENLSCFLMPHPGFKVQKSVFSGAHSELTDGFVENMRAFVPHVLQSKNLVVKKISGDRLTCRSLMDYMKAYVEVFQGAALPEIDSVFNVTARVNHTNIKRAAYDGYSEAMKRAAGPLRPFYDPAKLVSLHKEELEKAVKHYTGTRKLGSDEFEVEFLGELNDDIEKVYEEIRVANDNKSVINSFRTPITFGALAFFCNILCTILSWIGMETVGVLINMVTWTSLLAVGFWFYCNYSGLYSDKVAVLDDIARTLYAIAQEHVIKFIFSTPTPVTKKDQ